MTLNNALQTARLLLPPSEPRTRAGTTGSNEAPAAVSTVRARAASYDNLGEPSKLRSKAEIAAERKAAKDAKKDKPSSLFANDTPSHRIMLIAFEWLSFQDAGNFFRANRHTRAISKDVRAWRALALSAAMDNDKNVISLAKKVRHCIKNPNYNIELNTIVKTFLSKSEKLQQEAFFKDLCNDQEVRVVKLCNDSKVAETLQRFHLWANELDLWSTFIPQCVNLRVLSIISRFIPPQIPIPKSVEVLQLSNIGSQGVKELSQRPIKAISSSLTPDDVLILCDSKSPSSQSLVYLNIMFDCPLNIWENIFSAFANCPKLEKLQFPDSLSQKICGLIARSRLTQIKELDFGFDGICNLDDFELLCNHPTLHLRKLQFAPERATGTNEGKLLKALTHGMATKTLTHLSIRLSGSEYGLEDIDLYRDLKLLTEEGVLPHLRHLLIKDDRTHFMKGQSSLQQFLAHPFCSTLESFSLNKCSEWNNDTVKVLLRNGKALRYVNFCNCGSISVKKLRKFASEELKRPDIKFNVIDSPEPFITLPEPSTSDPGDHI